MNYINGKSAAVPVNSIIYFEYEAMCYAALKYSRWANLVATIVVSISFFFLSPLLFNQKEVSKRPNILHVTQI